MTPQDRFVIVAQVKPERDVALRRVLATMTHTDYPGVADPFNAIVPFKIFDTIHFARFVVLSDTTLADRSVYRCASPRLPKEEPTYLCFMVDCDGLAGELMAEIGHACPALRGIFDHCADFTPTTNLLEWMRAHRVHPPTSYVNWVGRTVAQVHQEAELHALLRTALLQCNARHPQALLAQLRRFVALPPRQSSPTPLSWQLRNIVHLLTPLVVAAMCLILFPLLTLAVAVVGLVLFLAILRRHEQTDPIILQRISERNVEHLRQAEDHDVTNQYTALGSIKPGPFRRFLQIAILYSLDWAARHICTRGRLGRISTIHFAHWLFLDDHRRGFFCSYYDGGHEPYMDDFINKAGFGLNFSFSGAIGYPGTDWLLKQGAWREQEFKRFQRRHQIPTDVWYKAYPGLTAYDLARNSRIRNGFEKQSMSDDEIRRWLAEI
jgi:hypothetical protein